MAGKRSLFVTEPTIPTYEGGKAYVMPLKEQVVSMLCLGLVQNTFYEKEEDIVARTKEVYGKALKEFPKFLAQAAIYARNTAGMKLQPLIALAYLSTAKDKDLFYRAFNNIVKTPKDLFDFMEICRKSDIRKGLGRCVKKAVNRWLESELSEYHVCRYGGKIADVIKVTRPIPSDKTEDMFSYLIDGELSESMPRVLALEYVIERLNKGEVDQEVLDNILGFGLQLEEIKHTFGKVTAEDRQTIFRAMIPRLNYMALVSNLVTIERTFNGNVPSDVASTVSAKLSDTNSYRKSRMLPFRLITARDMCNTPAWERAIEKVLNTSMEHLFNIKESSVLIAVDDSGSMQYQVTPSLKALDIGAIFGGMLAIGLDLPSIVLVGWRARRLAVKTSEILTFRDKVKREAENGGTYLGKVIDEYKGEKYTIIITDSEQADDLERDWAKAKKPQGAKLIIWQTVSTYKKVSNRSDVIYLQGYSDRLVDLIVKIIEGKGQLAEIEKVEI